ncbi:uracil-DNA glycosylase [Mycoplasma sp. NEAQ87857]|uniref:uracil-DNA glycosylase n=1 Tax=Mycoplasma sp. NEAQ87857 TaxID=2683967 RepID=UPI001317ECC6|nr:uracil-DNA glycosylase [Mycoplasma sp. NEAQ87857]QGZ97617.1 uracil-DNA glycosylase [Mycoplasma sp. NEAQ87857]
MKDSFLKILQQEGQKEYFTNILNSLKAAEIAGLEVYPHQMDLFKAFEFFQTNETKVIFLGQDPYHTKGVADGLSFSTKSNKTPPSLNNIFKELKKDYPKTKIETNDLTAWAKQGVLLLNTSLSVIANKPNSHSKIGWKTFTLEVIKQVLLANPNVIVVLLGKEAQSFVKSLNIPSQNKIELSHPSPFSYKKGFENSGLFKLINKKLKQTHQTPIKWDLKK